MMHLDGYGICEMLLTKNNLVQVFRKADIKYIL